MIIRDGCPKCNSKQFKKNGHLPSRKQSHQCNDRGRQFVLEFKHRLVSKENRKLIQRLLAERISLRGICRAVGVGMYKQYQRLTDLSVKKTSLIMSNLYANQWFTCLRPP